MPVPSGLSLINPLFRIRLLLPVLVAVLGLGSAWLLHLNAVDSAEQSLLEQRRHYLLDVLSRAQIALEARQEADDTGFVQSYLARFAEDPSNLATILTDGGGEPVYMSVTGRDLAVVEAAQLGPVAEAVAESARRSVAQVEVDPDHLRLIGGIAVCAHYAARVEARQGCGLLLLVEDLKRDLDGAVGTLQGRVVYDILTVLALIALTILVIELAVIRRMRRIVHAMDAFASGDLSARSGLGGRDELAGISRATDRVIDRIADAQVRLSEGEQRFRAIFDDSTEALIVIDEKGTVTEFNKAAARMFGFEAEEILGRNVSALMPQPDRGRHDGYLANYLSSGRAKIIGIGREVTALRRDGTHFPIRLAVAEVEVDARRHFIATITDLTEMKHLEAQLRRAQKMEAVGQLTGGIAHDFNNLLGIIIGNLDLLQRRVADDPALLKWVERAQGAAERGATLTRRLLGFSRQSVEARSPVNVNPVLEGLRDLLGRSLTSSIALELYLAKDLWLTEIDPSALEDVLINLAINARDAMPDGGRLVLETRNLTLDPPSAGALSGQEGILPAGEYVEIAVTDTGTGIPEEIRERIFEPFFTTKEQGKGTGLGLAAAYGFAKQSGGRITVYSEPGMGTTFKILLPRAAVHAVVEPGQEPAALALPRGTERILIVDDEPELMEVAQAILEELGYRTLTATSGEEALRRLDGAEPVDLLFSDVVMAGGMDGFALAEEATSRHPQLKVLLTSGFTGRVLQRDVDRSWTETMLAKPYRDSDLAQRVRQILDGEA